MLLKTTGYILIHSTLFEPVAKHFNLYSVSGAVCESIGLSKQSNADLVFSDVDSSNLNPENIKIIFEVKMSIVSNYEYEKKSNQIEFIGDYKEHKGNPSLLRSDSMLKAIGKSINIRVSGLESSNIPIIVLGNTPISDSYLKKVDFLKTTGVIQGFWSLNPNPLKSSNFTRTSEKGGFQTINKKEELI